MMGWLEGKIKECKVRIAADGFVFEPGDIYDCVSIDSLQVEYTGKIHEIAHVAREQVTRK